jgi:hypothetical protein
MSFSLDFQAPQVLSVVSTRGHLFSPLSTSEQDHAFPGSPNSGLHRLHRRGCIFWYTWLLLATARSLTDFSIRFPCCSLAVCLRSRTSLQPAPECSRWWCVCGQHCLDRYLDYAWWIVVRHQRPHHPSTQETRMVGDRRVQGNYGFLHAARHAAAVCVGTEALSMQRKMRSLLSHRRLHLVRYPASSICMHDGISPSLSVLAPLPECHLTT